MSLDESFSIRGYKLEDRNYITKSISGCWIRHPANRNRSIISLKNRINWLLKQAIIKVVCFKDDPDSIVGFIICQPAGSAIIIHALHVKGQWRRLGVATELLTKVSKQFRTAIRSINLQDEDLILPTAVKLFDDVQDKTMFWKDDRGNVPEEGE